MWAAGLLVAGAIQAAVPLPQAQLPAWWSRLQAKPSFQATFEQEGESAVFGKVTRKGTLRLAPGGRLRVSYDRGLLIVSDGRKLIQYDPDTHSAQRLDLRRALADAPLLSLLLDPKSINAHFKVEALGNRVKLIPRESGLPTLEAEGLGLWPTGFAWADATGARQVLRLKEVKAAQDSATAFTFTAPAGTRWTDR